jgi:hypothetical protein
MAKRKGKANRRRPRQSISLINTVKTLAVANVFTQGAANANLMQFFTGRTDHPTMSGGVSYYQPDNADSIITLPELLGMDRKARKGADGVFYPPITHTASPTMALATVQQNIKDNALSMGVSAVITIAGFKVADRVLAKSGIKRGVNKTMKFIGLNEVKA